MAYFDDNFDFVNSQIIDGGAVLPTFPVLLSVRDDPGNNQALVTISNAGEDWILYRSAIGGVWQQVATGSGDVTDLEIADSGGWIWQVASKPVDGQWSVWSAAVFASVSGDSVCPHEQIIRAVAVKMRSLPLVGSPSVIEHIVPRRLEIDSTLPAVVVAPFPVEGILGKLNSRDDIGYPVTVALIDKHDAAGDDTTRRANWLKLRRQIMAAFRQQRLPGINNQYITDVAPAAITDLNAAMGGYLVGAMVLNFRHREERGIFS